MPEAIETSAKWQSRNKKWRRKWWESRRTQDHVMILFWFCRWKNLSSFRFTFLVFFSLDENPGSLVQETWRIFSWDLGMLFLFCGSNCEAYPYAHTHSVRLLYRILPFNFILIWRPIHFFPFSRLQCGMSLCQHQNHVSNSQSAQRQPVRSQPAREHFKCWFRTLLIWELNIENTARLDFIFLPSLNWMRGQKIECIVRWSKWRTIQLKPSRAPSLRQMSSLHSAENQNRYICLHSLTPRRKTTRVEQFTN